MMRSERFGWLRRAFGAAVDLLAEAALGGMRVAVVGRSMEPALREGDHLLVGRLAYRFGRPRRGDIVFLQPRASGAGRVECIKRIVGLPHERVCVSGERVLLDGRPLREPYLHPALPALPLLPVEASGVAAEPEWRLGAGEYLVLGDNRRHSTDSRAFGPVSRREIAGRAWYRYAPAQRRGRIVRPAVDIATAGR